MKLIKVVFLCISIIVCDEDFKEHKKEIRENFDKFKKSITDNYKNFKEEQVSIFEENKRKSLKKWDEFKYSTNKKYVEYSKDFESRLSIDFEEGLIVVEVLGEKTQTKEKTLENGKSKVDKNLNHLF